MIYSCLMWRTIKVWDVMQTSIRPVSNMTGNWVPRTTDSSRYLLWHTRWWIVMIHCFVLAHSTSLRTRLHHLLWTRWWHCANELNVRYAEICDIPSSHQEAIAWVLVNDNDYNMSWTANDYIPDLELSITSNYPCELMPVNGDKRDGSIGPWYSKDCVYQDEVYIDTTHIEVALEG